MRIRKTTAVAAIAAALVGTLLLAGCGTSSTSAQPPSDASGPSRQQGASNDASSQQTSFDEGSTGRAADEGAQTQTGDPTMPTRVVEGGTKVSIHFGDTVIPATLNDSETARALIGMLPYTVRMSRYSHDFCGVMSDSLPYDEAQVHNGWLNGDVDFATDANYFTILFADQDSSSQYGYQVNIGVIDCPLSGISSLEGSYDVTIELAQ